MMQSGTKHLGWLAALALVFAVAAPSYAQDQPSLGDEFIFFVDGTNVLVPGVEGQVVDDPLNPGSGNKVMQFNNGNFAEQGWNWPSDVGVDASQNRADGDKLYIRILSDPANNNQGAAGFGPNSAMRIQFTDKTSNSSDKENGDHAFRVSWVIPSWVHDGQWHELAIPLPPATEQELDSLRAGKDVAGNDLADVDSLAQMWYYNGAWTDASSGITPSAFSLYGDNNSPELFREFEWTNVKEFGVSYDWGEAGGNGAPIFFDYFYIGDENTSIDGLSDPPAPLTGVSTSVDEGAFSISWQHDASLYSGYQAYVSDQPITDLDSPLVLSMGTFSGVGVDNGTEFTATYNYLAPHTSLAGEVTMHFAVAPTNAFGVRNDDVSGSQAQATGSTLAKPHAFEITEDDADALFDILDGDIVEGGPLVGTYAPFEIGSTRYREGGGGDPDTDIADPNDLSAKLWAGFMPEFEEVYVYAEVRDDTLNAIAEGSGAGTAWNYDSIEINWGMYGPQSLLVNSTHSNANDNPEARGAEPDYQIRIAPEAVGGEPSNLVVPAVMSESFSGQSLDAGAAIAGVMEEDGQVVGWNILAFIPWSALTAGGDQIFAGQGGGGFPTGDELKLGLMNIMFNDNDALEQAPNRSRQGMWTQIPGSSGSAWNNATQWEIIAFAGMDVPYDPALVQPVENFIPGGTNITNSDELPEGYALEQNYPNPFNPTTTLAFSIPQAQDVSLTVYNMLGQQVATLVNDQLLTAGRHEVAFNATELSSGVYVYRLDAGAYSFTKSMLLIK